MVFRGVLGEEALARWGDKGMADVGEDACGAWLRRMVDEANTKFVSRAFETNCYHD